jgi:hypothetical protein
MSKENGKRRMWQAPWGFAESVAIVAGIVLVGFALQLTIGDFDFYLLTSPANLIAGGCIVLVCITLSLFKKSSFLRWFSEVPFSVALIVALLVLTIIMGLTPQSAGEGGEDLFSRLGFDQMTRSWAFVLIYFVTLLPLGSLIARRLRSFRWRDYGFYCNHIGLWLVLFAAGLGHVDIERYIMHVREGKTEWRVYDDEGNVKELPIAIQLNDFDMEEYPPKLTVIDRESGEPQPVDNPDFYQIDPKAPEGHLAGWDILLEEYIHQAVRSSDSTYREVPMPGATPATRITATNKVTGESRAGWVCGGNQAQLYMTLSLTEQYAVVMTVAEPKRFMSDVEVYTKSGVIRRTLLEVNKPIQAGSWTIYQHGYDNQAGRLSSYSSMELVYDPWKTPVYIGFGLIALGSLAMIWCGMGQRKNRKRNDLG